MCGIAGQWNRDGTPVDRELLERARDTMVHRGPDDAGMWFRGERGDVGLAHRRLSIVDLSAAGHQPMANEDGSVIVTFNGEIYNHHNLRRTLEDAGHRFRGQCDAEVLVHLWEERGEAMVHDLVGMFAFGLWDERRQTMFVARDRLGVKPLYWIDAGGTFAFASEIKALLPLAGKPQVDPVALADYLTFVCVPPPRTMFVGVHKLAPATRMLVRREGPETLERYWDPIADRARLGDGAEDVDWSAEVMERLRRSVERRMMADVPVGVFLSGGVDSSTNVALVGETTSEPVNTFSIAFHEDDAHDELAWARRVAEKFGTNHHETRIGGSDLWEFLPDLVFHQDEPIADPVCVPLYFVSKLAKDSGVTVVHVGEGADELFAGYPTYVQAHRMITAYWRRFRILPRPLRTILARAGASVLRGHPRYDIHREALLRGADPDGHLWWGGAIAFYPDALRSLTTDRFRRDVGPHTPSDVVAGHEREATRYGARDELDRLIYQDLRLRLPELLLMRVDKLTMAASVEAREPFLDHELVELAMTIPAERKIEGGIGKVVLKKCVEQILDPEIVWRPKQGFGTPVSAWFRGPLGDLLAKQLDESAVWDLDYLRRERVAELLEQHRSGRAERSFQLWNVLNLSTWYDHWIA